MWVYHSPIGDFQIRQLSNGRYGLYFADILWGSWHSPEAAADDVYMHETSCYDWDRLDGKLNQVPSNLSEWERY